MMLSMVVGSEYFISHFQIEYENKIFQWDGNENELVL